MVNFTVDLNPSAANRSGAIQVGDQTFTVNQTASACGFSLQSYGAVFNKDGNGVGVSPPYTVVGSQSALGCNPDIGTDQPSIVALGSLTGPVLSLFTETYSINEFTSLVNAVRVATINFGGQLFQIKQTSW